MSFCPICDKNLVCQDSEDSRHKAVVGSAVSDCPARKGSIWVQVLDDKRAGVLNAKVSINGKPSDTDDAGFAYSDPLIANTYDVELTTQLPDTHKDSHALPDKIALKVKVQPGEIVLVKFRLERINEVSAKIEQEYKVVLLDRGLAAHQTGEPETDKYHPAPTRIEVSATETNRDQYPFKTTAKLICLPQNVDVFLDSDCKTPLTADLKADDIVGGKSLLLWLRGKQAGKFDVSLEFNDTGDKRIRPVKTLPNLEMGVVELVLEVYQHDIPELAKLDVDPDTEPIADYHTNLLNKAMPALKVMTDVEKIKAGRLLHEQKDSNHSRAKLVIKKLLAAHCPDGTDDYEVYVNHTNKSGSLEIYDAEWDGSSQSSPTGPFKFSQLKSADKELWVEGKTACSKLRDLTLDLSLGRPVGGLAMDVKRHADCARFTVVKLNKIKLDYTAPVGGADAWDPTDKRFFINLLADPDGRKITIGAQLSEALTDVVVHFMLVEHKDNRKIANWGVDLPDGTRLLNPVAAQDDSGTPQVFGSTEPKWTWKDISKDVKHLDKTKRDDLLHCSEKTDSTGYAKKEVTLSRFAGDKFYLAAYIEQDPHLAKYIDGHTTLEKRKPVMTTDPIQVWRKFWYKEVKVAGLLVSDFRNAAETYKDVKALMVPGTVVEMPRLTADAISPRVIYPKHMVSYYISQGAYLNNFPGDMGDALVVGDPNESEFFSLAAAETDKPVMYPMLNAHALWIPGGTCGIPLSEGPFTTPYAPATDYENSLVTITCNNQLLDKPLQGGNLLVRGNWAAQDWIPHSDLTLPSGANQPSGAPVGSWGNYRNGTLAIGDVSLNPNRSDPRVAQVTLPTGCTKATHTRVKLSNLHVQCASSFLGTEVDPIG